MSRQTNIPLPPTPLDPRMYTVSSIIFLHCVDVGILKSKPLSVQTLSVYPELFINHSLNQKQNKQDTRTFSIVFHFITADFPVIY